MGMALTFTGILLIVTGAQNTYAAFGNQLRGDFTGQNNFTWWFLAIIFVGMLGYIPALKSFSRWFLALILIAILFSHKGFFASLTNALKQGPVNPSVPRPSGSATAPGTSLFGAPAAGAVTPQQGVQQGNAGVGIDWLAPFRNLFK
jgi:hypothetical protein